MSPALTNSLPLMGIWNVLLPLRNRDGDHAHYPSWGFGTFAESLRVNLNGVNSLPLMGIWNIFRPAFLEDAQGLITPHGDLEPASRPVIARS